MPTEPSLKPVPEPENPTQDRILGLPRNIFFLGITSLFNDASSEMVYAAFPAFFTSVLHAGAESLGLVDGIAEAASNLFKIYSGSLSDRFQQRKPLVVAGYTISIITRPFYVLAASVGGALVLRFLDRVGKGVREAPRDAILSLSSPKEEMGRSFGYHRTMDTIGATIGPLVAYLILRQFPQHFDFVFLTSFIVGILALFTLIFIKDVKITKSPQTAGGLPPLPSRGEGRGEGWCSRVHHTLQTSLSSFSNLSPHYRHFIWATFVLSIGSLPVAILLLATLGANLTIADIPLFYMLYNVSYAIFSTPAGKLSDRIGARTVICIGYGTLLAGYGALALAFAHSTPAFIAAFLLLGLFPALTDGNQRSFASQLTRQEMRGSGLGWLNAANGFGALIAGIAGGYLWQTHGPGAAFLAASLTILIGLTLLLNSVRTTRT